MSPRTHLKTQRSFTGNHGLLPASQPNASVSFEHIPHIPNISLITWSFGRASVIWRIWPAVFLHTCFAAVIVTLSMRGMVDLEIPGVMLTVLGVVIGFVISYRAMSGYDRYWMGRSCWSDVMKNARTIGRLIWFHVPPYLSIKTTEEAKAGRFSRLPQELSQVMAEKQMALDLIEGFAVSLKHHIRGELGIYYKDLYHLIKPMHDHKHHSQRPVQTQSAVSSATPSPPEACCMQTSPNSHSHLPGHDSKGLAFPDPIIPPINAYGTFQHDQNTSRSGPYLRHSSSNGSSLSINSEQSQRVPLLPSARPLESDSVLSKISGDLIPFSSVVTMIKLKMTGCKRLEDDRQWHGLHVKHRPRVAGAGENLPLEILLCLSQWFSVLEDRGTVPGTSLGAMIGCVAAFEDSLTALERILTTPLPFVYSVHINTVWMYLFFLPFQLVGQFGYFTIPGVAIAAFIYLGFVAAGEEIEQPFGYDENDLDLDLFCHEIIHADMKRLKTSPCLNAYLGPQTPIAVEVSNRDDQELRIPLSNYSNL